MHGTISVSMSETIMFEILIVSFSSATGVITLVGGVDVSGDSGGRCIGLGGFTGGMVICNIEICLFDSIEGELFDEIVDFDDLDEFGFESYKNWSMFES